MKNPGFLPLKDKLSVAFLLFLVGTLFLTPLHASSEKELTFMIYMAADNDLENSAIEDINELETCGSTDKVNFVVQIDRNGKYSHNSLYKWSGTRRYYITKDTDAKKISSRMIRDLGEINTADPLELVDFVYWAKSNYPAKRYALILWSHGSGWKKIQVGGDSVPDKKALTSGLRFAMPNAERNIAYDYTSRSSMEIPTFGEALSKINAILGRPLYILGFDACLMQMAEVAYSAAPFASFQVGSPDREPDRGWPYDMIAREIVQKPDMDARTLGTSIARLYKKSYSSGPQGNTAILLSVIDMAESYAFQTGLDNFCNAAKRNIIDIDKIEAARIGALKYYDEDYIDLGNFLELIMASDVRAATRTAAAELLQIISGTAGNSGYVCNLSKTGKIYDKSRGVSIYFPSLEGFTANKNVYGKHRFCTSTEWFNFLQEVFEPGIPYFKIEDVIVEDQNKDGRIAAGEEIEILVTLKNLGKKATGKAEISCNSTSSYLDRKKILAEISKLPESGKSRQISVGKFKVNDNTPVGSEIKLEVSFKSVKSPVAKFQKTFCVNEQFVSSGQALLVLTDALSKGSQILQQMIKSEKIKFDSWDRLTDGELRPEILKRYANGWVIISVQDSTSEQSLNAKEVTALDNFLKTGGRLVLNGQDLGFSLRDSKFLRDRCRVEFVQDDVNVHVLSGDHGFLSGRSIRIFGGDGANNQKWPDEIDPLQGAVPIIRYDEAAGDKADDSKMAGPSHKAVAKFRGIKSSGVAGVKVENGYRLMLFTFGIESIDNIKNRRDFMRAVADFMQPEAKDEAQNLARALVRYSAARQMSDQERLERTDMLASVEKRLLQQVSEDLKQDPQTCDNLLEEINSFSSPEHAALSQLKSKIQMLLKFKREHDR
ncbi:MAG: hypothetical protein KKB51_14120 [Candidatus Riflebacteria bacterium]|nr:hypothetical protein [Candidatus Riflebacteria bacterium]